MAEMLAAFIAPKNRSPAVWPVKTLSGMPLATMIPSDSLAPPKASISHRHTSPWLAKDRFHAP